MPAKKKANIAISVNTQAATKPLPTTLSTSEVPLEWLKKYSSPKPLRRPEKRKDKKSE